MQSRFIQVSMATLSLIVSCRFPSSQRTQPCEEDAALCPHSSRAATSVTCDCRCTIGISEDSGETFAGAYPVCLPSELNPSTASPEQKLALAALDASTFDQRVFQYCSENVARFVHAAIKSNTRLELAACGVPVRCECSTTGSRRDSSACRTECKERPCTAQNCTSVLRRRDKLDMSSCACTRARACGEVVPGIDEPRMCRDWMTLATMPTSAPIEER